MEIITPGHCYKIDYFETGGDQYLQFIHKEPNKDDPAKLDTIENGTTNEEVILVLLNRCEFLWNKFPSNETAKAIQHLESALWELNTRTRNRIARGVEGKHLI